MIITLTENELRSIIKDAVFEFVENKKDIDAVCGTVLNEHKDFLFEMAFKRKDYKQRIENLSAQIIENWCLIRHSSFHDETNLKKYWCVELKGHLLTVARYNIKGSDKAEDKEQAIREVWDENDYFDPKTIEYVIHNKFRKEGFDTDSIEFLKIINDCINSFNIMLPLISEGDISKLYNYVDNL